MWSNNGVQSFVDFIIWIIKLLKPLDSTYPRILIFVLRQNWNIREIRDKQRVNIFSIEQYYACVRVLKSVGSSEDIVVTDSGSVKNMKIYMNKDCKDHFLSIKNIAYDLALYPMSV